MVYGYVRVSTENQRDNWSTDVQRQKIIQFATNIGESYRIYEEVQSAKSIDGRPELKRLLIDLSRETYSTKNVWVVEQTRLARDVTDADTISKLFRKYRVQLYINDVLNDLTIAGNRLIYGIQSVVAAHEREQTGERIKRSKKEAADKGFLKNSALLGYVIMFRETGETYLSIDEGEAKVVRKIYEDYLEGISVNRIAMELNELGYKTKRGKRFEAVTVSKLLNHPYYFGYTFDSEGNVIPSKIYKPLLEMSREEFFEARLKRKPKADKFKNIRNDVSAVIRCAKCGAKYYIHRKIDNGKPYFYLCHFFKKGGIQCDQFPKYIDFNLNCREIERVYEESLMDLSYLSKMIGREHSERPDTKQIVEDADKVSLELEYLNEKKKKLLDVVENGVFSFTEIKERVEKINQDIEKQNELKKEMVTRMRNVFYIEDATEEEAVKRISLFKNATIEQRHKAFMRFIKSCTIDADMITLIRSDREIFQWNVKVE